MVFTLRGPAVGYGIVGGGHGDRLGAADGLRRRRGEISGRDRRGRAGGIGRRRQRGYRDILLPRHETLGLRLVAILEPVVDQLVLLRKILASGIVGKLLHRPAVGRDQWRLLAAKTATALLIGEGQGPTESNGAEQRATHHEGAPAFERHPCLGAGARRGKRLTLIEEIGIEPLALVEILRRPAGRLG